MRIDEPLPIFEAAKPQHMNHEEFVRRRSRLIFWEGVFFFEMMSIDEKGRVVLRVFMMR